MSKIREILIILCALAFTSDAVGGELEGKWSGMLRVSAQYSLKLVFNISNGTVTIDSPDQNAYEIPGKVNYLSADSLNVSVRSLGMNYAGSVKDNSIEGKFTQGGFTAPLVLKAGYTKPRRPQTPQPPFPYSTEEVTITAENATLAGTLTVPENPGPDTPVVVLVSGSGLQNRDEEIFEHKPFAVIADYLARHGIASLRYDDRGYGHSKGDASAATTADFASDAEAVVKYLRRSGRFSKIGMIGHSEGGSIAYILGNRPELLDFIISIAGPTVTGAEINAYQNKVAVINSGVDVTTAENFSIALLKALKYRLNNPPMTEVSDATLREFYPQYDSSDEAKNLAQSISATLKLATIVPWMEYFLKFNPEEYLRGLNIPTMIIFGEKDCQVPPSLCTSPAREMATMARVEVYPGLNHMMQHAATGNVEEYKTIEETISPQVLHDLADFINFAVK